MKFNIEESYPQTAHVVLASAQEKEDFLELLEKLGAERLMAVTAENEQEEVEEQSDIHRVLEAVRKLGRCTILEIIKEVNLSADSVNEKLETLLKAGKIKKRMGGGVAHYRIKKGK